MGRLSLLGFLLVGCATPPGPLARTEPEEPPKKAPLSAPEPESPRGEVDVDAGADAAVVDAEASSDPDNPFANIPGLRLLGGGDGSGDAHEECGSYRVDTIGPEVHLVDSKGRVVKKLAPQNPIEHYAPVWCFDVTGDGTPELVVTRSSGGAHCCHEHTLFSLGAKVKTLLVYPAGNGSLQTLTPTDVDGTPPWELVDTDDILVQYGSTAYAFTRFLPVVFAFQNGRYVRRTSHYPEYLERERKQALDELHACGADCWGEGEGEWVLGLSLLIGDWDQLKKTEPIPASALTKLEVLRRKLGPNLKR